MTVPEPLVAAALVVGALAVVGLAVAASVVAVQVVVARVAAVMVARVGVGTGRGAHPKEAAGDRSVVVVGVAASTVEAAEAAAD